MANIWVEDLATHARSMVSLATQRGIGRYEWTYDSTHLIYFSDENGNEDDHLYSIDLKTKAIRDLTPFLGVRAGQVLQAAGNTREILVGLNLRDRRLRQRSARQDHAVGEDCPNHTREQRQGHLRGVSR